MKESPKCILCSKMISRPKSNKSKLCSSCGNANRFLLSKILMVAK